MMDEYGKDVICAWYALSIFGLVLAVYFKTNLVLSTLSLYFFLFCFSFAIYTAYHDYREHLKEKQE